MKQTDSVVQFMNNLAEKNPSPEIRNTARGLADALTQEPVRGLENIHEKIQGKNVEVLFGLIKVPFFNRPAPVMIGEGHEGSVVAGGVKGLLLRGYSRVSDLTTLHTHLEGVNKGRVTGSGADVISLVRVQGKEGEQEMVVLGAGRSPQETLFTVTKIDRHGSWNPFQWQVTVAYYQNLENPHLIHVGSLNIKQYMMAEVFYSALERYRSARGEKREETLFDTFVEMANRDGDTDRRLAEVEIYMTLDEFLKQEHNVVMAVQNQMAQGVAAHQNLSQNPDKGLVGAEEIVGLMTGGDVLDKDVHENALKKEIEARTEKMRQMREGESLGRGLLSGKKAEFVDTLRNELKRLDKSLSDEKVEESVQTVVGKLEVNNWDVGRELTGIERRALEAAAQVLPESEGIRDALKQRSAVGGEKGEIQPLRGRILPGFEEVKGEEIRPTQAGREWISRKDASVNETKGEFINSMRSELKELAKGDVALTEDEIEQTIQTAVAMLGEKSWEKGLTPYRMRRALEIAMRSLPESLGIEDTLIEESGERADRLRLQSVRGRVLLDAEWEKLANRHGFNKEEESFYSKEENRIYMRASALSGPSKFMALLLRELAYASLSERVGRDSTRAELMVIQILSRSLGTIRDGPIKTLVSTQIEKDILERMSQDKIKNAPLKENRVVSEGKIYAAMEQAGSQDPNKTKVFSIPMTHLPLMAESVREMRNSKAKTRVIVAVPKGSMTPEEAESAMTKFLGVEWRLYASVAVVRISGGKLDAGDLLNDIGNVSGEKDIVFVGSTSMWGNLESFGKNVWFMDMDIRFNVNSEIGKWVNNILNHLKPDEREKLKQNMKLEVLESQTKDVEDSVQTVIIHQ
ncbi:MAG: hypothetical protein HY619_01335 [Thaumarchaeota archaeon]|nr:hypothetical protein [Nitrososphaerota archaeon]